MANKKTDQVWSTGIERNVVGFSFATNSSTTALDRTYFTGDVSSVTRTDVGVFTCVLKDQWPQIVSGPFVSVQSITALNIQPQVQSYTGSSGTLVVRLVAVSSTTPTAYAAADLGVAGAGNKIHVWALVANTAVTP